MTVYNELPDLIPRPARAPYKQCAFTRSREFVNTSPIRPFTLPVDEVRNLIGSEIGVVSLPST
jgi:hypothetical protein